MKKLLLLTLLFSNIQSQIQYFYWILSAGSTMGCGVLGKMVYDKMDFKGKKHIDKGIYWSKKAMLCSLPALIYIRNWCKRTGSSFNEFTCRIMKLQSKRDKVEQTYCQKQERATKRAKFLWSAKEQDDEIASTMINQVFDAEEDKHKRIEEIDEEIDKVKDESIASAAPRSIGLIQHFKKSITTPSFVTASIILTGVCTVMAYNNFKLALVR